MRWCLALAIVLCALLVATARVAGSHRSRRPPAPMEESGIEMEAPAASPSLSPSFSPAFSPPWAAEAPTRSMSLPPVSGRRERPSVARLHGRVLLPPGAGDIDDLDDLQVDADDGVRLVT